jgi:hypothetical protein
VVEGPTRAGGGDKEQHAFEIIEHIARRNAQRVEADTMQDAIASEITMRVVAHRVRHAIHFDQEAALKAGEIGNVAAARELAAKSKPVGALSELLPEDNLGQRHPAAEPACATDVRVGRANRAMPNARCIGPSTMLRMVPLPVPGRILSRHHRCRLLEQTANGKT